MPNTPGAPPPKLLHQMCDRLRVKHYSIHTETQYLQWVKRFISFRRKRHPKDGRTDFLHQHAPSRYRLYRWHGADFSGGFSEGFIERAEGLISSAEG